MSMVINTNISALNTLNQLNKNSNSMNSSLEKLSSGYQINSAADDAAGLAISEKMRSQIRGLDQASDNAQDATSLAQTADGALDETESILQRMRELAVQASSDSLTDDDRSSIQDEVDQLRQEIDDISDDTEYNTKSLLNGSLSTKITVSGTDSASVNLVTTVAASDVKSGDYTVSVTSAATSATLATDTGANLTLTASTASIGDTYAGDTLTINNSTVSLSSTDTLDGVVNKINALTDDTGVTATLTSNGTDYYIQLTSNEYGSDSEISLTVDDNADLALFAAVASTDTTTTSVSAKGSDITGTINGIAATGDGNTLTSSDGGITVDFKDGVVGDGDSVTVNVDNSNVLTFQVGANEGQTMTLSIDNMSAYSLGVAEDDTGTDGIDVSTSSAATSAITSIDSAIAKVSAQRAKLGATENRLEHTINNLDATSENISSAESNIRDVDMASEMANYTKLSVLTQAATAMLAQANQQPQQVLKLLQ